MALTHDFKQTIRARAKRDPKFWKELLCEGIESAQSGDAATAETVFCDYTNALEPAEAIRLGIAAAAEGRTKPARQALAELQEKLGIPDRHH